MPEAPLLGSPTAQLLLPLFLHFGLVVSLYAALTWARLVAVRRGEAAKDDFARADGDPPVSARIQRNLANQFEAPVFVWIAALVLILSDRVTVGDAAAAWVFLAGRLIHTAVQCSGDNVALRGQVFTINFLGLLWLMAHAFLAVVGAA
ncbi:MAG: MAPEG family protein [Brevundimonas sp.]|uniref:MAPEG family protein n=1 Tax=Brevundimonas sp. TaxID=1871086 RepID=UPI002734A73A|nr:MAPEG family protein [Brevundimonas sp.]MDP3656416.1 MAPEG family protein [Brevundimonas sp.]MDZ4108436.1 MAPEG family protein [Brevundimonas sp.]